MSNARKGPVVVAENPSDVARRQELQALASKLKASVPGNDGLTPGSHGPQRIRYFRGKKMIEYLLKPENQKGALKGITNEKSAEDLCEEMLRLELFVRAEAMADDAEEDGAGRGKGKSKRHGGLRTMVPIISRDGPTKRFEHGDKDRYIWWRVTEDTFWPRVKLGLAVLAVLAMCLYQLWPPIMRTGVWYLSVTFLLLLLATIAVQLIVFAVAWLAGWEVWVLPNLWADVPVHKIFSPPIEYKKAGSGAMWTRIALAVCIAGLGYWVYSTPTELQAFLDTQRQMVDDLYSGKLLADGSAAGGAGGGGGGRGPQSNMFGGKWGPGSNRYGGRPAHIPNFEDIEKMVDDFETSTGTASTETPIPTPPPEEGAHAEGEQHAAPDLEAMFEADAQQEAAEAAADAAADAAAGDTASVKSDDSAADL